MWSSWLERTLRAREAGEYEVRRLQRDRAYTDLRHDAAAAQRAAACEDASETEEMAGAA
jgi:hypothetical protein